ncbi:MAG: relaxase/mobilization nuclease domain-containing protein, partial [Arcobacter sp.]|nr:relaxase/mobilization nuclease domain-containing protein [Arcobacter sp.]
MNDFLSNMKSFVLYQQITKLSNEKNKNKSNNLEDDLQLEMIKFKKAISSSPTPIKIENLNYKDYSSAITKIDSPLLNASENIKDTFAKNDSLSTLVSKASSQSIEATNSSIIINSGSTSLNNYSSTFSFSSSSSIPVIKQFGLIKMTGTEGNLKNGYTIGKEAKQRASASIEYVTRDENGKSIAELKDKNGNVISKQEAKQEIQNIAAERRLVLSPNPRLNISEEQLDKVVRETMSSYSESFGKEFNYFYAIHNNTKTPHAHIIMTSSHPDGDGIKMYKDELFELKMNFEDNLKELVKDSGINIKDESTIPTAKQIANFIGAIPDTSLFMQNKFLAQKIAKKFDLEFDQKQIGNNPEKLENWFSKNDNLYKEYFMSATNKDAFLFQD